ncbi:hypothetical protein FQA47_015146 [Oryzias melastigma]|uniref:Uncharacterized protein n=1 Tax=Oryzias melastigma TaxID=30732 RepID=A0A834FAG6_ORYME|nr:hypothetical protein FQA47_015146 [Oryzias melastigma]
MASGGVDQQQVDDLEKRVAAVEEMNFQSKLEDHDEAIAALQEVLQRTSQELAGLFESMAGGEKSSVEELRSEVAALSGEQTALQAKDSDLDLQVEELKARLAALEEKQQQSEPRAAGEPENDGGRTGEQSSQT